MWNYWRETNNRKLANLYKILGQCVKCKVKFKNLLEVDLDTYQIPKLPIHLGCKEKKREARHIVETQRNKGLLGVRIPLCLLILNQIKVGTRKRIRVKVGELGTKIQEQLDQRKAMFGEIVSDIMKEKSCSWEEAKKIYKTNKVERAIKREFNLI